MFATCTPHKRREIDNYRIFKIDSTACHTENTVVCEIFVVKKNCGCQKKKKKKEATSKKKRGAYNA